MKGEVYRLPAPGKGHEQKGRRYAVVLQAWFLSDDR
ncbi:type II toxin-antitoxin system PemK/MazF family toxin [Arthrobacter terrae]|nr:type II toxin-antitoxin system PemK/MazF family toxin [Arthrobacter terrae]